MALSLEEVRKIAQLARLELTSEEEQRYAETISAVLDYMKILHEVDTNGVEPTSQVTGLENVFRPDEVHGSTITKELLAQMSALEHDQLAVPAVFDDEEAEL